MLERITPKQFLESDGVADWRIVGSDGACAFFPTASFAESVRFVRGIGDLAGVEDHRPRVDIRRDGVTVSLISIDPGYMGMSRQDADLARQISVVARQLGLSAIPTAVQSLLVVPGATDIKTIMPFWRAALGYEPRIDSPDEDLVDPHDRLAAFWFEQMKEPRGDGGGAIHLAVWVAYEEAEARVAAALAAGGHMVRDEFAPRWWTLADAMGNEVDIATISGRA
ncbi:MAG TPA: VOC family protein [Candidatus Limnocylindria bacterium]